MLHRVGAQHGHHSTLAARFRQFSNTAQNSRVRATYLVSDLFSPIESSFDRSVSLGLLGQLSLVREAASMALQAAVLWCLLQGKRVSDVTNRMHVALPKPRDNVSRPRVIPSTVVAAQVGQGTSATGRKLQRQIQVRLPTAFLHTTERRLREGSTVANIDFD